MRTSLSTRPRRNGPLARPIAAIDPFGHQQGNQTNSTFRLTRQPDALYANTAFANTAWALISTSRPPASNDAPANYQQPPNSLPVGGIAKRTIDVAIACFAIVLLAPLMLIVVALIKMVMGGPTVFAHLRIGHNGKPFKCYKFRTMARDADTILRRHLESNPEAAEEWRATQKLRKDPRVTPLGNILRKSSLDELPQLMNVLRGDMSCVGPRPIVADELQRYGIHSAEYLKARPGLTGMWQVSGRNRLEYAERVAIDCHYIQKWSLWTDLVILAKTLFVVVHFDETS